MDHARDYVFAVLFKGDDGLEFVGKQWPYNSANYPAVQDWKKFHDICQMYMDMTYRVLEELEKCIDTNDYEGFKNIMVNVW